MKRTLLLAAFMMLMTSVTLAKPVSLNDASRVAANFWQATTHAAPLQVSQVSISGFSTLYVFDINQGKGFVIVPADDVAYPILGYSTNSTAAELGPEARFWLNQYEQEILALTNGTATADKALAEYVQNQWDKLLDGTWLEPKSGNTVPQLMNTTWNQAPYYNNYCPTGTPVGCTATATVQVMKYWNYPQQGTGSYSYYDTGSGQTLSADFGNTTYHWDLMPNNVTASTPSEQIDAVALLSYHVGVACDMNYNPSGSGAMVIGRSYRTAEYALVENFGYSSNIQGVYKDYYSDQEWDNMLRAELDARRPIIYAGYDNSAGHCFVFDGYNASGLYHVNWGWGGSYDGYYAVGALNPGGGGIGSNTSNTFNNSNQALFGVQPSSTLSATPSLTTLYQPGGAASVQLTASSSNARWNASSNASWLTVSPISGNGNGATTTLTLTATANNGDSARSAEITIIQGTDTILLPVSQFTCNESDLCPLTINMYDRRADGWENAYLTLATENGVLYGTATVEHGASTVATIPVNNEPVVVTFHPGFSDNDCGFFIHNSHGQMWVRHNNGTQFDTYTYVIPSPCATTGGEEIPSYTITAEVNDTTRGTVTGADSLMAFGDECVLYALAAPGYRFVRWNDGVRLNPRTVIATADRTLTATFSNLGSDTMQYDCGQYASFMGGGSDFEWAIRLRPEDLVGRRQIDGVKFFPRHSGSYTITIYQGTDAPETNIGRMIKSVNNRSINAWNTFTYANPVTFDYSKPVWVAIKASSIDYPAATSYWCGNENSAWVFRNGTWSALSEQEEPEYTTFLIRPILPVDPNEYTVTVSRNRNSWGTVTGGGTYRYGEQVQLTATPSEGYHFERWSNHVTDNPYTLTVVSDTMIRAMFAEGEPVGIDQADADEFRIYTAGRQLTVNGAETMSLSIYDAMGRQVFCTKRYDGQPIQLPFAGLFLVRIDDRFTGKVIAY